MNLKTLKQYRAKRQAQLQYFKNYKDDLLSEADKPARILRAQKDYDYFCRTYFAHLMSPEGKLVPNAPFHLDAARYIKNNPDSNALFEWARGHAKSTHISLLIPLWLKIQSGFKVMVLVSKSQDMALRLLSDIQIELMHNARYIQDFGAQVKQGEWEVGNFVTQDNTAFFALGRGQSPRGLKYAGNRPDYIVVDDIDDDELVRNDRRIAQLYEWLLSTLLYAKRGNSGRFIVVGNRIGKNSILSNVAANPLFYHTTVNALNAQGLPVWPEHYTAQVLKNIRATSGERAWQKEMMNNPITEGSVFKELLWAEPLPLKQYSYLVSYTDPSFKNTDTSDYKATVLVGKTKQGHYHILKAFVRKASIQDMVEWHYSIYEEIKQSGAVVFFYMESNYIQDLLLDNFRKEGEKRALHLPLQGDNRKKPDKYQRIENLQPLVANGILLFNVKEKNNADMQRLSEQFLLFQKGSRINDDGPDAVEGAIYMLNQKTAQNSPIYTFKRGHFKNKHRY